MILLSGNCISRFESDQYGAFYTVATNAGYLTGTTDQDRTYDLGGDEYTFPNTQLTWQNGTDLYNFLWQDTSLPDFATRYQVCDDIDGISLIDNHSLEIPVGYTTYQVNTSCIDIDNPIGQIGNFTPTTTTTTSTKTSGSETDQSELCGEVQSDGTSTDVSVKVCINLQDDIV